MGVGYTLVNATKRETIGFYHVNATVARELAGNPAASAIVTWYLLHNLGDRISFISDSYDDWSFAGSRSDLGTFTDKTEEVIADLIANGILRDDGFIYQDPDDPDDIFIRKLTNIWGALG